MEYGEVFVQVQSDFLFCFAFKALTSFGHQNLDEFFYLVSNRCFGQSPNQAKFQLGSSLCFFKADRIVSVLIIKILKIV